METIITPTETFNKDIVIEEKDNKPPKCEVCGFSLVDSTQGMCNCGKYSW